MGSVTGAGAAAWRKVYMDGRADAWRPLPVPEVVLEDAEKRLWHRIEYAYPDDETAVKSLTREVERLTRLVIHMDADKPVIGAPVQAGPNVRVAKTHIWGGGRCYFVSTIDRESSAPDGDRYAETLVWEFDYEARERGALMPWTEAASEGSISGHQRMVERIRETGSGAGDDEFDDGEIKIADADADADQDGGDSVVRFVCLECAHTGYFYPHVDWESGQVDDLHCGRCGSTETDELDNTNLVGITETIRAERAAHADALVEIERLQNVGTATRGALNAAIELIGRIRELGERWASRYHKGAGEELLATLSTLDKP